MEGLGIWYASNETLVQTSLVAILLAFSFQVTMRAGVPSFAGAGFWAIGGYMAAILAKRDVATVIILVLVLLFAAVVGLIMAIVLGRLRSLYLAMATTSFVLLLQVAAISWTAVTGGAQGIFLIPVRMTTLPLAIIVGVAALLCVLLERGRSGRTLEALRLDEEVARTLGINVRQQHVNAFVLSSMLGSLSGALNALMVNALTPDQIGFYQLVNVLMMVVIGGMLSSIGAAAGAVIVTWLPSWLSFAGLWRPVLEGVVVLIMIIYIPRGLAGVVQDFAHWLRSRSSGPGFTIAGTPGRRDIRQWVMRSGTPGRVDD